MHSGGTLFLHIGLHKTGTSFLQHSLAANADLLAEHGIRYPPLDEVDWTPPQHVLLVKAIEAGDADAAQQVLAEAFARSPNVLMSAERFGPSPHRYGDRVARWLDDVKGSGRQVKAIVYLRRQDLFAQSLYRTFTRNPDWRLTLTFAEFVREWADSFDYWTYLAPWEHMVGPGNLIVRPYERGQWPDGDLLADFLAALGIEGRQAFEVPDAVVNLSFNATVIELLRRTNAGRDRQAQGEALRLLRHVLPDDMLYDSGGGSPYMGPDEQSAFLRQFEDSNRRVAREWLGRPDGRLFHETVDEAAPDRRADISDAAVRRVQALIRSRLAERAVKTRFSVADAMRLRLGE